jgi:hypothetical protein
MVDRLALRVEDAVFQRDVDAGFHLGSSSTGLSGSMAEAFGADKLVRGFTSALPVCGIDPAFRAAWGS